MPPEIAFAEQIVRKCARGLVRYARHADPEDLMQEARLELWLRRHVLDEATDEKHRTNLARKIARTAMCHALRRSGYRYEPHIVAIDWDDSDEPLSNDDPMRRAQAMEAARAIPSMPIPLPDIAMLMFNDWPSTAIARLMGVSYERFDRLRVRLRRRLAEFVG